MTSTWLMINATTTSILLTILITAQNELQMNLFQIMSADIMSVVSQELKESLAFSNKHLY
jgi:hypothetical protein